MRMNELIAMVQENGTYPSSKADDVTERSLAAWLQRRRRDVQRGALASAYRDGLAVLPNWQGTPRAVAFEAAWQDRLAALVAYRASGHDWPRHKATVTGIEHELGIWLHTQRFKLRRGELNAEKAWALDSAVPGWSEGRRRGRKSQA